ncbi:hypothetical protein [Gemmiger formicilis]|uniref:hypothetical protein n=1 Tax=Gemmiger formicilis TaxID=745368 RepID=UPI002943E94F|nr:hypothetical protein [Gemmiger formicilis]
MKSFDEHFKGAKNHNQEDLKWLLACYYGTMMNLCNEYSYFGDEDLFGLMLEWFWWDFERFEVRNDTDKTLHRNRKYKRK